MNGEDEMVEETVEDEPAMATPQPIPVRRQFGPVRNQFPSRRRHRATGRPVGRPPKHAPPQNEKDMREWVAAFDAGRKKGLKDKAAEAVAYRAVHPNTAGELHSAQAALRPQDAALRPPNAALRRSEDPFDASWALLKAPIFQPHGFDELMEQGVQAGSVAMMTDGSPGVTESAVGLIPDQAVADKLKGRAGSQQIEEEHFRDAEGDHQRENVMQRFPNQMMHGDIPNAVRGSMMPGPVMFGRWFGNTKQQNEGDDYYTASPTQQMLREYGQRQFLHHMDGAVNSDNRERSVKAFMDWLEGSGDDSLKGQMGLHPDLKMVSELPEVADNEESSEVLNFKNLMGVLGSGDPDEGSYAGNVHMTPVSSMMNPASLSAHINPMRDRSKANDPNIPHGVEFRFKNRRVIIPFNTLEMMGMPFALDAQELTNEFYKHHAGTKLNGDTEDVLWPHAAGSEDKPKLLEDLLMKDEKTGYNVLNHNYLHGAVHSEEHGHDPLWHGQGVMEDGGYGDGHKPPFTLHTQHFIDLADKFMPKREGLGKNPLEGKPHTQGTFKEGAKGKRTAGTYIHPQTHWGFEEGEEQPSPLLSAGPLNRSEYHNWSNAANWNYIMRGESNDIPAAFSHIGHRAFDTDDALSDFEMGMTDGVREGGPYATHFHASPLQPGDTEREKHYAGMGINHLSPGAMMLVASLHDMEGKGNGGLPPAILDFIKNMPDDMKSWVGSKAGFRRDEYSEGEHEEGHANLPLLAHWGPAVGLHQLPTKRFSHGARSPQHIYTEYEYDDDGNITGKKKTAKEEFSNYLDVMGDSNTAHSAHLEQDIPPEFFNWMLDFDPEHETDKKGNPKPVGSHPLFHLEFEDGKWRPASLKASGAGINGTAEQFKHTGFSKSKKTSQMHNALKWMAEQGTGHGYIDPDDRAAFNQSRDDFYKTWKGDDGESLIPDDATEKDIFDLVGKSPASIKKNMASFSHPMWMNYESLRRIMKNSHAYDMPEIEEFIDKENLRPNAKGHSITDEDGNKEFRDEDALKRQWNLAHLAFNMGSGVPNPRLQGTNLQNITVGSHTHKQGITKEGDLQFDKHKRRFGDRFITPNEENGFRRSMTSVAQHLARRLGVKAPWMEHGAFTLNSDEETAGYKTSVRRQKETAHPFSPLGASEGEVQPKKGLGRFAQRGRDIAQRILGRGRTKKSDDPFDESWGLLKHGPPGDVYGGDGRFGGGATPPEEMEFTGEARPAARTPVRGEDSTAEAERLTAAPSAPIDLGAGPSRPDIAPEPEGARVATGGIGMKGYGHLYDMLGMADQPDTVDFNKIYGHIGGLLGHKQSVLANIPGFQDRLFGANGGIKATDKSGKWWKNSNRSQAFSDALTEIEDVLNQHHGHGDYILDPDTMAKYLQEYLPAQMKAHGHFTRKTLGKKQQERVDDAIERYTAAYYQTLGHHNDPDTDKYGKSSLFVKNDEELARHFPSPDSGKWSPITADHAAQALRTTGTMSMEEIMNWQAAMAGVDDPNQTIAWLRTHTPSSAQAFRSLVGTGRGKKLKAAAYWPHERTEEDPASGNKLTNSIGAHPSTLIEPAAPKERTTAEHGRLLGQLPALAAALGVSDFGKEEAVEDINDQIGDTIRDKILGVVPSEGAFGALSALGHLAEENGEGGEAQRLRQLMNLLPASKEHSMNPEEAFPGASKDRWNQHWSRHPDLLEGKIGGKPNQTLKGILGKRDMREARRGDFQGAESFLSRGGDEEGKLNDFLSDNLGLDWEHHHHGDEPSREEPLENETVEELGERLAEETIAEKGGVHDASAEEIHAPDDEDEEVTHEETQEAIEDILSEVGTDMGHENLILAVTGKTGRAWNQELNRMNKALPDEMKIPRLSDIKLLSIEEQLDVLAKYGAMKAGLGPDLLGGTMPRVPRSGEAEGGWLGGGFHTNEYWNNELDEGQRNAIIERIHGVLPAWIGDIKDHLGMSEDEELPLEGSIMNNAMRNTIKAISDGAHEADAVAIGVAATKQTVDERAQELMRGGMGLADSMNQALQEQEQRELEIAQEEAPEPEEEAPEPEAEAPIEEPAPAPAPAPTPEAGPPLEGTTERRPRITEPTRAEPTDTEQTLEQLAGVPAGEAEQVAERVATGAGLDDEQIEQARQAGGHRFAQSVPKIPTEDLIADIGSVTEQLNNPETPHEDKEELKRVLNHLHTTFEFQHPHMKLAKPKRSLGERLKGLFKEDDGEGWETDCLLFLAGVNIMKENIESYRIAKGQSPEFFKRVMPNRRVSKHSHEDIMMMANRLSLTTGDVRHLIFADGSWNDISKATKMPIHYVQVVKIAFEG